MLPLNGLNIDRLKFSLINMQVACPLKQENGQETLTQHHVCK